MVQIYEKTTQDPFTSDTRNQKMTIFVMLWNAIFLPLFRAAHEMINTISAANEN